MQLDVNILNANPDLQTREIVYDTLVVAEYAEAMRDGAIFPPVTVFFDGATYWLADGFHRWAAAQQAGIAMLDADVRSGGKREAILFAVGANAANGLRRTNADKRKAVMRLLNDEEWQAWSDREIARACAVAHMTVARLRSESICNNVTDRPRIVTRNGSIYEMNTARIGKEQDDTPTAGHRFDAKVNKLLSSYAELTPPTVDEDEPPWVQDDEPEDEEPMAMQCVTCRHYNPDLQSDEFYCMALHVIYLFEGYMPCDGKHHSIAKLGCCDACQQPLPVISI